MGRGRVTRTLAPALALALATTMMMGCAGQAGTPDTAGGQGPEDAAVEAGQRGGDPIADGQNPVMNFVGTYGCGRATVTVTARGANEADISVQWGSSASSGSEWTMSGTFDDATRSVRYTNGTRVDYEYQDEDTRTDAVAYEGGTGTFSFGVPDESSMVWHDDVEDAAEGMVFTYSSYAE